MRAVPTASILRTLVTGMNVWGDFHLLELGLRFEWIQSEAERTRPGPEPFVAAATAAKSLQSCPTLCDPTDGSPPGSPVPGILQARTLQWVAISFSNCSGR